jgi:CheY-like chemotaxis protein
VDDNHDGADSLAMLLEEVGHETHQAHDGVEALEAAETRSTRRRAAGHRAAED